MIVARTPVLFPVNVTEETGGCQGRYHRALQYLESNEN